MKQNIEEALGVGDQLNNDDLLLELQKLIFRYDVSILKNEERLRTALEKLREIKELSRKIKVPHVHGFVRLQETQCMVDTAELILEASIMRKESRLSHIREDHPRRDDARWLKWVLIKEKEGKPYLWTEPIPTPWAPPEPEKTQEPARGVPSAEK